MAILGNTTLDVFPLCLGGNVFGWTVDEPTAFEIQKDSLKQRIGHLGWSMRFLQAVRNLKRQQELKNSGRSQVFLSFHNFKFNGNFQIQKAARSQRSPQVHQH